MYSQPLFFPILFLFIQAFLLYFYRTQNINLKGDRKNKVQVLQCFPPSTDHEDSHLFCPLLSSHIPGSPIFVSLAHASTVSLFNGPSELPC